ncbi:unnamed protein product, partial [Amoebophrya sp. A25]|eukprot:GSA25T00020425001.1
MVTDALFIDEVERTGAVKGVVLPVTAKQLRDFYFETLLPSLQTRAAKIWANFDENAPRVRFSLRSAEVMIGQRVLTRLVETPCSSASS